MRRMNPLAIATVVAVVVGVVLAVSIASYRHAGADADPPTDDPPGEDIATSSPDRPQGHKKRRRSA